MRTLQGDATKRRLFATAFDNTCASLLAIPVAARFPGALSPITRGAILVITYLAYFFVQEGIWSATLGKLIFGLRVVRLDGSSAGWWASFWRTVLRVVEVNPVFGAIPGGLVVTKSHRKQRLGDMLAGTVVVRRSELVEQREATRA